MKTAICVPKIALFPAGVDETAQDVYVHDHSLLLNAKPTLEDRATCETDPTLLQIIPYITLFDNKTKEVFVYRRGEASGEQRLSGKCSIGLGGHMEMDPKDPLVASMSLIDIIVEEAAREIEEEVGIANDSALKAIIRNKLMSGNFGLMYNTRTEVDRVHIAVAMYIGVDAEAIMALPHEADVITKGQWMGFNDMQRAVKIGALEIEHWTRMVLESAEYAWTK